MPHHLRVCCPLALGKVLRKGWQNPNLPWLLRKTQTSQRHGETWTKELCKFHQTILKVANLNETWILSPSLSNEKQFESWLQMQLSFPSLFQRPTNLNKPLLLHSEVDFLWQHQCFDILRIGHQKIANLVSRCEILSPIWRQRWEYDIKKIVSSIHRISVSLFHCQVGMVYIFAVPTVESVLYLSQDICHSKPIQSNRWNHNDVTHIVTTSNSLSNIHLTPNQGYHWVKLRSKPENFSNLSEASFFNPSSNGMTRLMPYVIKLFSSRREPRVQNPPFEILSSKTSLRKLWASHMYV